MEETETEMREMKTEILAEAVENILINICRVFKTIDTDATEYGVLLEFARDLLKDPERIFEDARFRIGFRNDNEVAVEATFDGIHLHTEFLKSDSSLETVYKAFTNPKVTVKAALWLVVWALKDAAQTMSQHLVRNY